MKTALKTATVAALIGLGWAGASTAAYAESNTALQHAALRKACTDQGGRFELSWIYNDQGLQWGKVLSCATSAGYVTCQGNVCRGGRWVLADGVTPVQGGTENEDSAVQFPAEPVAFSAALAALSGE